MKKEEQISEKKRNYSFQKLWPATRDKLPDNKFIYITVYLETLGRYNMDEIKLYKAEESLAKDLAENSQQPFFYRKLNENDNPELIINDLILGNPKYKVGNRQKFK